MDETAATRKLPDPTVEEIRQPATYGGLKALCEEAAEARLPGRVTHIRPGFIVGPGDETDRFTYWPARIADGGEVLAPGSGEDYVQFIDVRDLGRWIVHCLEANIVGTFNAHHPARELTMGQWLAHCRETLNPDARLTWIDAAFLEEHRVAPQSDMPIWLPGGMSLSAKRAHGNGLMHRPLTDTVADTHAWFRGLPGDRQRGLRAGISRERETEVLAAWHGR
jgi:2'-hydroxyisoflavone reductase